MSGNRTERRARMQQQGYSLSSGRGHEFQKDQPHDLPLSSLAQTPRNMFPKSVRIYRPDLSGALAQAQGAASQMPATELAMFLAVQRKANFTQLAIAYTTAIDLILPATSRTYFLIQNLDAAANLFVGFGFKPNGLTGSGFKLVAGAVFEPFQVPQNDIFISGSAAGTASVLFAVG